MIEYPTGDDWVALFRDALPLAEAPAWAITPSSSWARGSGSS